MYHGNIQTGKTDGPSLYSTYATWEDYDGAVDAPASIRVIGMGRTQADAIKDLIESTSALDEDDARIDEYAEYLRSKAEAEAEDCHAAKREDAIMEMKR